MKIHLVDDVPKKKPKGEPPIQRATAAILYFTSGVTPFAIQRWLQTSESVIVRNVEHATIGEYDPTWGSPVWYIR